MIRFFTIILTIGFLSSCFSTEKQKDSQTTEDFKSLETIIPFAGFWVNERYLNDIKKSKSPRESQGFYESCITIPERTLQVTRMVWGFHDGGADLVVVKNKDRYQFYYKYNDTIRDFAQDIEIISKEKIKIGDNFFIKTNSNFLEEILFKSKYVDSNGTTVEFTATGKVVGLGDYKIYRPLYDYNAEGMNVDQIALLQTEKDGKLFGFKFNADTLLIYELNCLQYDSLNNMCVVVDFGQMTFKLTRKN